MKPFVRGLLLAVVLIAAAFALIYSVDYAIPPAHVARLSMSSGALLALWIIAALLLHSTEAMKQALKLTGVLGALVSVFVIAVVTVVIATVIWVFWLATEL